MTVLDDFEIFCAAAADAMDHAGDEQMAFIVPWRHDAVHVAGFTDMADANKRGPELVRAFHLRRFGAMATRCYWSPDDGPSSEAWALLCLEITQPAQLFIRRLEEDERWWALKMNDAPWFLASSAGALRSLLEHGEWTEVKEAHDARLFGKVRDGDIPPVDEKGRI